MAPGFQTQPAKAKKKTAKADLWEDVCGACEGAGELLCCSSCPAAYHIRCAGYSGPEDIPGGLKKRADWTCWACAGGADNFAHPCTTPTLTKGQRIKLASDGECEIYYDAIVLEANDQAVQIQFTHWPDQKETFHPSSRRIWHGEMKKAVWVEDKGGYRGNFYAKSRSTKVVVTKAWEEYKKTATGGGKTSKKRATSTSAAAVSGQPAFKRPHHQEEEDDDVQEVVNHNNNGVAAAARAVVNRPLIDFEAYRALAGPSTTTNIIAQRLLKQQQVAPHHTTPAAMNKNTASNRPVVIDNYTEHEPDTSGRMIYRYYRDAHDRRYPIATGRENFAGTVRYLNMSGMQPVINTIDRTEFLDWLSRFIEVPAEQYDGGRHPPVVVVGSEEEEEESEDEIEDSEESEKEEEIVVEKKKPVSKKKPARKAQLGSIAAAAKGRAEKVRKKNEEVHNIAEFLADLPGFQGADASDKEEFHSMNEDPSTDVFMSLQNSPEKKATTAERDGQGRFIKTAANAANTLPEAANVARGTTTLLRHGSSRRHRQGQFGRQPPLRLMPTAKALGIQIGEIVEVGAGDSPGLYGAWFRAEVLDVGGAPTDPFYHVKYLTLTNDDGTPLIEWCPLYVRYNKQAILIRIRKAHPLGEPLDEAVDDKKVLEEDEEEDDDQDNDNDDDDELEPYRVTYKNTKVGDMVDSYYEGAWWPAIYKGRAKGQRDRPGERHAMVSYLDPPYGEGSTEKVPLFLLRKIYQDDSDKKYDKLYGMMVKDYGSE